jgi:hypothetical protein
MMWGLTRYAKLRREKKSARCERDGVGGRCQEIIKDEDLQQILSRHEERKKRTKKCMLVVVVDIVLSLYE